MSSIISTTDELKQWLVDNAATTTGDHNAWPHLAPTAITKIASPSALVEFGVRCAGRHSLMYRHLELVHYWNQPRYALMTRDVQEAIDEQNDAARSWRTTPCGDNPHGIHGAVHWVVWERVVGNAAGSPFRTVHALIPPPYSWPESNETYALDISFGCAHTNKSDDKIGNCLHRYTCRDCGYSYTIDSSD